MTMLQVKESAYFGYIHMQKKKKVIAPLLVSQSMSNTHTKLNEIRS